MLPELSKIKGVHPGVILKREIKSRGMKNYELAQSINEYPQTISAILKEKRGINPHLSIKLGNHLGVDEDYFMLLQSSYDVKKAATVKGASPDLSKIRKVLFWDTDFDKINWIKQRRAVLKRVFERGTETEIEEIIAFYGLDTIKMELKDLTNDFLPSFKENLIKYGVI